jgi:hypothetical protein
LDAFVDGYTGRYLTTGGLARTLVAPTIVLVILAVLMPSVREARSLSTTVPIVVLVIAYQTYRAASIERRFGRPTSRSLTAAAGVFGAAFTLLAPFALVSLTFGQTIDNAPTTRLIEALAANQPWVLAGVVVAFSAVALGAILAFRNALSGRSALGQAETELAIRREREARARSSASPQMS